MSDAFQRRVELGVADFTGCSGFAMHEFVSLARWEIFKYLITESTTQCIFGLEICLCNENMTVIRKAIFMAVTKSIYKILVRKNAAMLFYVT